MNLIAPMIQSWSPVPWGFSRFSRDGMVGWRLKLPLWVWFGTGWDVMTDAERRGWWVHVLCIRIEGDGTILFNQGYGLRVPSARWGRA